MGLNTSDNKVYQPGDNVRVIYGIMYTKALSSAVDDSGRGCVVLARKHPDSWQIP